MAFLTHDPVWNQTSPEGPGPHNIKTVLFPQPLSSGPGQEGAREPGLLLAPGAATRPWLSAPVDFPVGLIVFCAGTGTHVAVSVLVANLPRDRLCSRHGEGTGSFKCTASALLGKRLHH